MDTLLPAAPDAGPLLGWGSQAQSSELRRYRDMLYVVRPLPEISRALQWQTDKPLQLPAPLGQLSLQPCAAPGLPLALVGNLEVRFRSGGEQVKAAGRPTRLLKKVLQDSGVPPWLRDKIPLLYVENKLVAVADLLITDAWQQNYGDDCCRIVWQRSDLDCGY